MDPKDWWLAAVAATSMMAPLAEAASPPGERVGVVTSARPTIRSASGDRVVYVGNNVSFGEHLATDSTGVIHILFMDQSSITLGPNTEVTIDEFYFRPAGSQGGVAAGVQIREEQKDGIAVGLVKGVLRVVGGLISKRSPTRITTSTATLGIRGGITLVEAHGEQTRGVFLFGHEMQMTTRDGRHTRSVTRPGFGLAGMGGEIGEPFRVPVADFAGLLSHFESRPPPGTPERGAPAGGPLLSAGDRPGGIATPDTALAADRLDRAILNINTGDPRASLHGLLGTGDAPVQS